MSKTSYLLAGMALIVNGAAAATRTDGPVDVVLAGVALVCGLVVTLLAVRR